MLILTEEVDDIENVVVLFVCDVGLYAVEIDNAFEEVIVILVFPVWFQFDPFESVLHCLHILLEVCFEGDGEYVMKIVLTLLRIQIIGIVSVAFMRDTIELVCNFSE